MTTPLINKIKTQGGTLYTFQSSTKDITKTFNNANIKFNFSKFACIDFPDIKTPFNGKNDVQFDTIDGALVKATNLTDKNLTLSEHFQNYVLNLESSILNMPGYDNTTLLNTSERIFFKWLKELGAIRFQKAKPLETSRTRYIEEETKLEGSQLYESVVKYIGDLNVTNNVNKGGDTYSQIFVNIPSSNGKTPTVLFKTMEDNNYYPSMRLTGSSEYIVGRDNYGSHPTGLTLSAFYDYENEVTYTGVGENWYDNELIPNTYYTQPHTFTDETNTAIIKKRSDYGKVGADVEYIRTNLDGIMIDFDISSYTEISENSEIGTLSEFSQLSQSEDFTFNAILIYYDLYNVNVPEKAATNLYGVLFLDNVEDNGNAGSKIKPFKKYKFNPVTKLNGNSYGLKLNIKFDSSIENTAVNTVINDYESYSLSLYNDAMSEMKLASKEFHAIKFNLLSKLGEIEDMKNMMYNFNDIKKIKNQLNELQSSFENANILVGNMQSINDAISNVALRLDKVIRGETVAKVTLDFDLLRFGNGFKSSVSDNSKMIVENTIQKYSAITHTSIDYRNGQKTTIPLRPYTNLFIEKSNKITLTGNCELYIDDTITNWNTGQTYELSFLCDVRNNNGTVTIYTDAAGRNGKKYGIKIGILNDISKNSKYQIVCLDQFKHVFMIEKL